MKHAYGLMMGLFVAGSLSCALAESPETKEIFFEVTGGQVAVSNWVAETSLNTQLLSIGAEEIEKGTISVFELDPQNRTSRQVPSQIDPIPGQSSCRIAWQVPGELPAGQTRRFKLRLDIAPSAMPEKPICVEPQGETITVVNGDRRVTHHRAYGGMIRTIRLGGASADFYWHDKVYDGKEYKLADHPAEAMTVLADGPIRSCIEVKGAFLHNGQAPESKPTGTYRFTTYAGLPIVQIDGTISQQYPYAWKSIHFIEIQLAQAGMTHWATDKQSGALIQSGQFYAGLQWAAVYNAQLLLGLCAAHSAGLWDGGGDYYGAYLRAAYLMGNARTTRSQATLILGPGAAAVQNGMVQHWAEVMADPPKVSLRIPAMEARLDGLAAKIADKRKALGDLDGEAWAQGHVQAVLAEGMLARAKQHLMAGQLSAAVSAMERTEQLLQANPRQDPVGVHGEIIAGLVHGHPILANRRVAYLWAPPHDGGGLISIYQRQTGREFLGIEPAEGTFWQLGLQSSERGKGLSNRDLPCRVEARTDQGQLVFTWQSPEATVTVNASLTEDATLLRSRLQAKIDSPGLGLRSVTFPLIRGIQPITPEGANDTILKTDGLGWQRPSPLVTGGSSNVKYPHGMQFTALLGQGAGLYLAEEDGQANRKTIGWTPDMDSDTLDLSITHPVLNWAADEPVTTYQSPGDVVIGPFEGDWYDAARLYRQWALTAPWCAKGPLHQREDYPKWLLKAPYWTIGTLGDEDGIERELQKQAFYDVPTMIMHAYGYYFQLMQDDRYPHNWPPKLGSENFRKTVAMMQKKGIRIVPYVQGSLWDTDTDTFRMQNAKQRAALLDSQGNMTVLTNYGGGQRLAAMCPATELWRDTMVGMVRELVGRYGVDGIYFDFLTIHTSDCYNKDHGHALCGGNYWTQAVHGLYDACRAAAKELNPDVMLTGEDPAEFCIDVLDTFLCMGKVASTAPLFQAVYHGYANLFGGAILNTTEPAAIGRYWLWGFQNGWHNTEQPMMGQAPYQGIIDVGQFYKRLLHCRWHFGTPYLGYGEMLRPPRIAGELPIIEVKTSYEPMKTKVVEGTAWKAPDGTIGVFFLNYDRKNPHTFTWSMNLAESGIDKSKTVTIQQWSPDKGLVPLGKQPGGTLSQTMTIEPLGIIALKLEVAE